MKVIHLCGVFPPLIPHSMIEEYFSNGLRMKATICNRIFMWFTLLKQTVKTWWAFIGNGICSAGFGVQWIVLCFCFVKTPAFWLFIVRICLVVLQGECIESSHGFTFNGWQCSMWGTHYIENFAVLIQFHEFFLPAFYGESPSKTILRFCLFFSLLL